MQYLPLDTANNGGRDRLVAGLVGELTLRFAGEVFDLLYASIKIKNNKMKKVNWKRKAPRISTVSLSTVNLGVEW